jgi:hypothetical protein
MGIGEELLEKIGVDGFSHFRCSSKTSVTPGQLQGIIEQLSNNWCGFIELIKRIIINQ